MPEEFDAYRKWLGIPAEEQPPHHYRLLGIAPFEDDPDVIQNAADRQMAHVRNFQAGKHALLAKRILNELSSAKVCLLNAGKKADYDALFRSQLAGVTNGKPGSLHAIPPEAPPALGGVQLAEAAPPVVAGGGERATNSSPQPVVVGTAARPSRSGTAARFAKAKRRSNLTPLFLLVVCGLALGGVVAVVMNLDYFKKFVETQGHSGHRNGSESRSGKHEKDGTDKSPNSDKPEKTIGGKPPSKPNDELLFKQAPPLPPRPPKQDLTKVAREENLRKALTDARHALELRQSPAAHQFLIDADSFKANQKEADEIEQWRTVSTYLGLFWNAVDKGIHKLEPGDKFEFGGVQIELKKVEKDIVSFKIGDRDEERKIHDLDPKSAAAFAIRSVKPGDPFAQIYLATFLALDKHGDRQHRQWQLEQAKKLWHAAARRGEKNAFLARELGIDASARPEPGDDGDLAADSGGKNKGEDSKRD